MNAVTAISHLIELLRREEEELCVREGRVKLHDDCIELGSGFEVSLCIALEAA